MSEFEAIIVALTHMHEGRCCVGALQVERDASGQLRPVRNWRLLAADGSFPLLSATAFRVGEIWRVAAEPSPAYRLKPPHLEDSRLRYAERVGRLDEPLAQNLYAILTRNSNIPLVRGGVELLFQGKLQRDMQNAKDGWARYILPSDSPTHSTSFWIPNFSLRVEMQFNKLRAFSREAQLGLSYVAVEPRMQAGSVIPSGSLLRVSLARPWSPDENTPPKSYMMLSQFYGVL
ncbi:MAG: hypothetical protein NZM28_07125 [Fimbriimonadales bacterium]|nr:hypothetical protein [Fimbriimonadales bacterium]